MKNQKGITLIALVITIVVLIILAGVAINMTLGENGILTKAKQARNEYINAQIHEEASINSISEQLSRGEKDIEQITLNERSLTISKGETTKLTVTISPSDATNKSIIWSSSDASIATVENGIITAVGEGNATITATSKSDSTIKASCEVTVKNAVEQITLSESSMTISKGETAQLTATVIPSDATNKNIIWSSSDTSVATVENGTITAIGEGNATIIATSKSDNTIKASCEITVKDRVYLIKDGKALVDMAKTNISSVTENEGYITMETVNTGGRAVYYTTNTIDFSGYSKLNIDIELLSKTSSTTRTQLYLGIFLNNTNEDFDKSLLIADDEFSSVERKTYTKNLESLNDNYKIAILKNATSPASKLKCNIYNLWFEK